MMQMPAQNTNPDALQPHNRGTMVQTQKIQHPTLNYSVSELYMIRKQSIVQSNDLIVKRLSRCFQKIKKIKNLNREKQLYKQYDQDFSNVRKSWRKIHEIWKAGSKTGQITQKKIQKMKARIQKAKKQVSKDQFCMARQVDINKAYIRSGHSAHNSIQSASSQKNLQK